MKDSCQTHEEVTSYIWISHVTHQHQTYECNRWVRLRDLVPDLEIGYKTAKYRSTKVELFFSVKTGSAGLHKVAKTRRAMQGADGKDAWLARPSAAPSGSESRAACPVMIQCDWPLRLWLSQAGVPCTKVAYQWVMSHIRMSHVPHVNITPAMRWLRWVGSIKWKVSFAQEPYN